MWLIYAVVYWSFEGFGQLVAIAPNMIVPLLGYINLWFSAFLFCGMFVAIDDVIWPLRVFCYVLPLGWGLQARRDRTDHNHITSL